MSASYGRVERKMDVGLPFRVIPSRDGSPHLQWYDAADPPLALPGSTRWVPGRVWGG